MTGFYEDDEPLADVLAAFERGTKAVTRPPARGVNARVDLPGVVPALTITGGAMSEPQEPSVDTTDETTDESEPMPPAPAGGADVTEADGPQDVDLSDLDGQAAQVDAEPEEGEN